MRYLVALMTLFFSTTVFCGVSGAFVMAAFYPQNKLNLAVVMLILFLCSLVSVVGVFYEFIAKIMENRTR